MACKNFAGANSCCVVCCERCDSEFLRCYKCKECVHAKCSKLPHYYIVGLYATKTQYMCEGCICLFVVAMDDLCTQNDDNLNQKDHLLNQNDDLLNSAGANSSCVVCCERCDSEFLKCCKCKGRVHAKCSNLPHYYIVSLYATKTPYMCEGCICVFVATVDDLCTQNDDHLNQKDHLLDQNNDRLNQNDDFLNQNDDFLNQNDNFLFCNENANQTAKDTKESPSPDVVQPDEDLEDTTVVLRRRNSNSSRSPRIWEEITDWEEDTVESWDEEDGWVCYL
ncbi:hypothetical protein E2C01_066687 [Portunus trituberculatus]|uniref:Uncharacterized protein n=1 Tax=Portunus trituberculatus TaxID=210409 RepID=A0A5B7HQG7_PORTR|nr:hypothetical protein [Portunus trituberculatus]